MGGGSSGTGKHYFYDNTFYCPLRPFPDDMAGPREVRNYLFVSPGGALKTASAVYANTAYLAGFCRLRGGRCWVILGWWLVVGGWWLVGPVSHRFRCRGIGCCPGRPCWGSAQL